MDKNTLSIPMAIIIAGALIGGAVIYTGKNNSTSVVGSPNAISTIEIDPVTDTDHIRGDKNASITFVEFSDTECPFCKVFHKTMHEVVSGENKIDDVAWVYRHNPIPSLHEKATKEAEATECVATLGGEETFWKYIDSIYETTNSNDSLPDESIYSLAEKVGVSKSDLQSCLDSGTFTKKITDSMENAKKAGGRGTPFSVLLLSKKMSDETIAELKAFDLEVTNNHPTQRLIKIDEKTKDKLSLSGALPRELIDVVVEIIRK